MRTGYIIILITCHSKSEAKSIVNSLLKQRLIACGSIIPGIESEFRWNGKIERARETLVTLKAKRVNFKDIEMEVKRMHSYEVPEIIAVPIVAGSKDYLKWIANNT